MPLTIATSAVNSDSVEAAVSGRAAVVLTMEKETPPGDAATLRSRLRDERLGHAIQKANAEQARRRADCLRDFHDVLLPLLSQPCLTLDRDGQIIFWNDALAEWTGVAPADAIGETLTALFPPDIADALNAAFLVARHAAESESSCPAAPVNGLFSSEEQHPGATFSLLPLCRVPGCLESCLILFQRVEG